MDIQLKQEYVSCKYAFGIEQEDTQNYEERHTCMDIQVNVPTLEAMFRLIKLGLENPDIQLKRTIYFTNNHIEPCWCSFKFEVGMPDSYGSFIEEHDETVDYIRWSIINIEDIKQAFITWNETLTSFESILNREVTNDATNNTTPTKE